MSKKFKDTLKNFQPQTQFQPQDEYLVKKVVTEYQNKSQNELYADIVKMAREQNVSKQQLSNFAASVSPMLTEEQRQKLYQMIDTL